MFVSALPVMAQTAPSNNNANNRINVGAVASYTIVTSNIGADTQSQEDTRNGLLGATIWWQWTCPSTGWVRIDTLGSEIDTVIKVNTGSNLNSAMLGFNDDADEGVITSSLSFMATANTSYYLQIGGYQGEEGTIQLNITSGSNATPSHWPTAVVYTPSSINTASNDATISAGITLGGSNGISGTADLQFLRPNETIVTPTLSGVLAYNSGVAAANASCVIPRYSAPGSWNPLITLQPQSGGRLRFGGALSGRPYLLSATMLPALNVTNAGTSDVIAPALQTFSISQTNVNVNSAPASVTINATITDAVSGLQQVEVWLYHPTNSALNLLLPVSLTSGTLNSGTWSGQAMIPREYPTEIYSVNIVLKDKALNQAIYGSYSTLETPGGDLFFTISGGGAYWQWAYQRMGANSALVDLSQDANGDGISNLICYAAGIDPLAPVPAGALPSIVMENVSSNRLAITFRRPIASDTGLDYFPEFSSDLVTWESSTNAASMLSQTESWQEWKVSDHQNSSTTPKRFGRVRILYNDTSL